MKRFVRNHRNEIDAYVRAACPNVGRLSDSDREQWILNDEFLYTWARSEGVRI